MDFVEFLKKKRIDPDGFKSAKPGEYERWNSEYSILGIKGFDQYFKFLFNEVRRTYTFTPPPKAATKPVVKPAAKPMFKPKVGLKKAAETPTDEASVPKPLAKPVFKPKVGVKKSAPEGEVNPKPKPAFKPKVGVKKAVEISSSDDASPKPKPAFKPKVGVKPKPADSPVDQGSKPSFKPKLGVRPTKKDD